MTLNGTLFTLFPNPTLNFRVIWHSAFCFLQNTPATGTLMQNTFRKETVKITSSFVLIMVIALKLYLHMKGLLAHDV